MNNKVKFLRGTATEYEASTKDNDTFYYTTDDEKLYLGNKEITGGGVTIDDTLSDTSKNPVQNKVINTALNSKANLSDIPTSLPANGGNAQALTDYNSTDVRLMLGWRGESLDSTTYLAGYDTSELESNGIVKIKDINADKAYVGNAGNADTVDGKHASDFALKTDIPTTLPANGGTANTARETVSPNAKARLWEDSEGGNLRLASPDGNHSVEMDLYNNSFRMYFTDNGELTFPVDYNSTTKKFNINGNAETVGGFNNRAIFRPYHITSNANDCYTNGSYMCTPDTTNIPIARYGILVAFNGEGDKIENTWVCQNFYPTDSNYIYHRFWTNNTWTNWERMASVNDIPTSLPANGGNAATVNGLTVQTAVPANAKFTDTTYGNASTSAPGLVSTGAQTLAGNKTFNGQVIPAGASAVGTAQARKIYAGTSDMAAGTTALETGAIYLVYE